MQSNIAKMIWKKLSVDLRIEYDFQNEVKIYLKTNSRYTVIVICDEILTKQQAHFFICSFFLISKHVLILIPSWFSVNIKNQNIWEIN